MPIERMDHFTIVTKDVAATEKFYRDVLEFVPDHGQISRFRGFGSITMVRPCSTSSKSLKCQLRAECWTTWPSGAQI
jgi:catechol 2,3-dioxygenase-like lactoylglutathione lyase family enzyme